MFVEEAEGGGDDGCADACRGGDGGSDGGCTASGKVGHIGQHIGVNGTAEETKDENGGKDEDFLRQAGQKRQHDGCAQWGNVDEVAAILSKAAAEEARGNHGQPEQGQRQIAAGGIHGITPCVS